MILQDLCGSQTASCLQLTIYGGNAGVLGADQTQSAGGEGPYGKGPSVEVSDCRQCVCEDEASHRQHPDAQSVSSTFVWL